MLRLGVGSTMTRSIGTLEIAGALGHWFKPLAVAAAAGLTLLLIGAVGFHLRARLGYDRARVLLEKYAGLDLHQPRHSAATHLGEAEVPLQLIMGKTRHKNPRAAMATSNPVPKPSPRSLGLAPRRRTH
ncbi:DoxX family protein [Nonomuraea sp. NPDC050451]|uniref:DoxX family protein n=1 Tax=Nonomuraea sp. NPDC050451 TaxID=3364364 RepID=UPI003794AADD